MYSFLTFILSFLITPVFILYPRGRARIFERFGIWRNLPQQPVYWFHAASLGEYRGIQPLIESFINKFGIDGLILTATSSQVIDDASKNQIKAYLLPFDSKIWLRRVIDKLLIKEVIIAETEVWPAWISLLKSKGIKITLVNARISERSYPRYKLLKFFRPIFSQLKILAADTTSAYRFVELGAVADKVKLVGNIKYDRNPLVLTTEQKKSLKTSLFVNDYPVITLGSLRPGEENYWLPVIKESYTKKLNFIIAPRHQEKFDYFAKQLELLHLPYQRRTKKTVGQIILLDSLGELEKVYNISDLAFIGGTLVKIGGHNPIEASSLAVPIIVGPYMSNIQEVMGVLLNLQAAFPVKSRSDIERLVSNFLEQPEIFKSAGQKGASFSQANRGALARVLAEIQND